MSRPQQHPGSRNPADALHAAPQPDRTVFPPDPPEAAAPASPSDAFLDQALKALAGEVPPMPEAFSVAWRQAVRAEASSAAPGAAPSREAPEAEHTDEMPFMSPGRQPFPSGQLPANTVPVSAARKRIPGLRRLLTTAATVLFLLGGTMLARPSLFRKPAAPVSSAPVLSQSEDPALPLQAAQMIPDAGEEMPEMEEATEEAAEEVAEEAAEEVAFAGTSDAAAPSVDSAGAAIPETEEALEAALFAADMGAVPDESPAFPASLGVSADMAAGTFAAETDADAPFEADMKAMEAEALSGTAAAKGDADPSSPAFGAREKAAVQENGVTDAGIGTAVSGGADAPAQSLPDMIRPLGLILMLLAAGLLVFSRRKKRGKE